MGGGSGGDGALPGEPLLLAMLVDEPGLESPVIDPIDLIGAGGLVGLSVKGAGSQIGKVVRGLTTPSKYFSNRTAKEVSESMTRKFGPPKSVREGAETFYNSKTQRSLNLHTDPAHGPPHVDIRRRGGFPERKYPLAEDKP